MSSYTPDNDRYNTPQQPPESTASRWAKATNQFGPPLVTYILLGTTVLVYILQEVGGFAFGFDVVGALGAKVNSAIIQGQYWRLFTPMFLHGSILHIGFNMYALFIFGPVLERYYGHVRYLILYILAGFAGNVISFAFSPNPSLGSSTAIFGLIGAEAVFLYQNQELFAGRAKGALQQIIAVAVINLLIGLSPGIDNWGHVGGLIGGTLFALMAGPRLRIEGFPPFASLKDERENGSVIAASLAVGVLFVAIAGAVIYMHIG